METETLQEIIARHEELDRESLDELIDRCAAKMVETGIDAYATMHALLVEIREMIDDES